MLKGMSDDDEPPCQSASQEVPSKKTTVDDNSDSYSSPTPSKSELPKKETKKKKTKRKASYSDESSSSSDGERTAPKKPKKDDKAEAIAWANRDHAIKWKRDINHVIKYRQRKGLCAKELTSGPNNTRHVDLLTQLLNEGLLGLNITQIDTRIDEVTEDSSKQARRLLKALRRSKTRRWDEAACTLSS